MKKEFLKITIIFFVTVGVVLWGLNFIFFAGNAPSSKAAGETMTLSFNPATKNAAVNASFNVALKAKPSLNTMLRGYRTIVQFDKAKVSFESIVYNLGVMSPGLSNTTAQKVGINSRGYLILVGENQTPTGSTLTAVNGATVATLTFKSLSTSGSSIITKGSSFYTINPTTHALFAAWTVVPASISVNGGGPTPTIDPGAPTPTDDPNVPTPTDDPGAPTPTNAPGMVTANLKMKIKFQGIGAKPATDALSSMDVRVKLFNESTSTATDYATGTFTSDADGIWGGDVAFGNVDPNHKYAVIVKGPLHLSKKICVATPTETAGGTYRCSGGTISLVAGDNDFNFSGVLMLAGDLPTQDGSVTAYDTSLVRNNLGKTDADSLSKSDVNRDGKCDTQDYSLIIASLAVKNDEE